MAGNPCSAARNDRFSRAGTRSSNPASSSGVSETLEGFEQLRRDGKIRHYGVSNFDRADMAEWVALKGGENVAADQVLYNLSRRSPREYRERRFLCRFLDAGNKEGLGTDGTIDAAAGRSACWGEADAPR
jgi:predicted oxidoreductase